MPASTLNPASAEFYDSVLVPEVMQPWAELMVREAQVRAGMRTLDVACGTGVVARCAARACGPTGHSSGADIDPAMIEVARAAASRAGLQIEYQCAPASELPFEPDTFDAAFCLHGLQYFPDQRQALAEMRRVMRAGARLVAVVWTEMESCAGNWAMIRALESRSIDAKDMRKPFVLSDGSAMRSLAQSAGFVNATVRVEHHTVRFASTKVFVESIAQGAPSSRLALAKVPPSQWQDFLADVDAQLAPWTRNGDLQFPMAGNVLVAQR